MALSDFTGPDYIDAWTEDLDRRWPERAAMADCVVQTLVGWRGEWREQEHHQAKSPGSDHHATIRLLELGVGAGGLAQAVLSALFDGAESERTSAVEYTGIDVEPALVQHVDEVLEDSGYQDARLIQADLRGDAWASGLSPFDAIFTLQTLHDLGGVDALEAIYRQVHGLLAPDGILVNADFVVPFEKDDPDRLRRLPVETHQDLLSGLGFVNFKCGLQGGKMACMSARRV
ncbi:MAG: class I SAM-dependent methyltransferase [Gemmatimonadetes bacterium]|nr:class I SAM-dependent methyltransferase [Gemmatimonadota bacterium]